ncbi:MAG TPA: amino acid adenylation domain-containing protein, partial [Candidatus Angelobacter sp.]|nr:amino acid adenylation domain-containing protein [Candidatus Angelobacter sp.]
MTSQESALLHPSVQEMICFPASFAQRSLWFVDQLMPGKAAYNIPNALRIRGELDEEVLERTLQEIVCRHETLRTRFVAMHGEPQQVIEQQVRVQLPLTDLSQLTEDERESEAGRLAREEAQQPFNLQHAPLFRARLLRLAARDHVLLFTMHHIVSDAWSTGILIAEVTALYEAFSAGKPSSLPELPIQYADYTMWQREWLEGGGLEEQLAYWQEQLAGVSLLQLPTDWPRPSAQSQNGAAHEFVIAADLTQKLKKLAEAQGATLFMVLLAAFQTLLYRYSGQDDITVGTSLAGRNSSETERLIGFFINMLVLRGNLSGGPSFTELLQRTKEVTLEAYAHQDIPFEKLVEVLSPERNLGSTPLFQVVISLQNVPRSDLRLGAAELQPLNVDNNTSKFDLLLLHAEDGSGRLMSSLGYSTDLFEAATINRMIGHYCRLLNSLVSAPQAPIHSLDILSLDERRTLLQEFNATAAVIPETTVARLFEEQVDRTPNAWAVWCRESGLSYRELDQRANQLAHYLEQMGVGPEVLVGICLNRSLDMVMALLGVLKAGGAYVPLDPSYPVERLGFMLEDAQIPILVTESSLRGSLPMTMVQIVSLDEEWKDISAHSADRLQGRVDGSNLAYVIYTSGSTGRPKGVGVEHRQLANYIQAIGEKLQIEVGMRLALVSTYAADLGYTMIFPALCHGGCLDVVDADWVLDAGKLTQHFSHHPIDYLKIVPSHLRALLGSIPGSGVLPRRWLVVGGEASSWELIRQVKERGAGCRVLNHYGPTETTVGILTYDTTPESEGVRARGMVPVGRPLSNGKVYLLDKELNPVGVGMSGEVYIGGAGVARGYLQRSELTGEKFLPNPYSEEGGGRMYRTGDIGRYLADGNIEFAGRKDHQVKVRGYRIELGEIEAALLGHAKVREAVVLAREDEVGEKRLVAYVVAERGGEESGNGSGKAGLRVSELREHLLGRLPEYMVPSAFVQLEKLPLTRNGKLDRDSLPQAGTDTDEQESVGPRNPTEETLCRIWQEVLRRERVGIHDNFFALGGHSLVAVQVAARMRDSFKVDVALRRIFESPTIAQLAQVVDQEVQSTGINPAPSRLLPDIKRIARPSVDQGLSSFPASFAQQRLWFLDQLTPGRSTYNIPNALRIRGQLDVGVLQRSLQEVVHRHETLRTRFVAADGDAHQVIEEQVQVQLKVLDLTPVSDEQREAEARRLTQADAQEPFNLQQAPLFRAKLLRLETEDHVLLFTTHHIISDAWSRGVFIEEITVLYEAFSAGEPSPLPELAIQYADYSEWQRECLEKRLLEGQVSYWKQQLAGVSMLQLSTDWPRPPVLGQKGTAHEFVIAAELVDKLKSLGEARGATLFMVLLGALQTLLSRYSGQDDVTVGTPVAGRSSSETEKLIGFFINTLVLRGDLSGRPSFAELLQRTKGVTLEAYAHQDIPFEKLVEVLAPDRNIGSTPLFQVMMVLQNAPQSDLQLGGTILEPWNTGDTGTSKFDLLLGLGEDASGLLAGALQYSIDLFEAGTVARMMEHYRMLLSGIAAEPNQSVFELPLLTEGERNQIVEEWNATGHEIPEQTLVELFEEQVQRSPGAVAVVFGGERTSYQKL